MLVAEACLQSVGLSPLLFEVSLILLRWYVYFSQFSRTEILLLALRFARLMCAVSQWPSWRIRERKLEMVPSHSHHSPCFPIPNIYRHCACDCRWNYQHPTLWRSRLGGAGRHICVRLWPGGMAVGQMSIYPSCNGPSRRHVNDVNPSFLVGPSHLFPFTGVWPRSIQSCLWERGHSCWHGITDGTHRHWNILAGTHGDRAAFGTERK